MRCYIIVVFLWWQGLNFIDVSSQSFFHRPSNSPIRHFRLLATCKLIASESNGMLLWTWIMLSYICITCVKLFIHLIPNMRIADNELNRFIIVINQSNSLFCLL
jgi:hypothetical protein